MKMNIFLPEVGSHPDLVTSGGRSCHQPPVLVNLISSTSSASLRMRVRCGRKLDCGAAVVLGLSTQSLPLFSADNDITRAATRNCIALMDIISDIVIIPFPITRTDIYDESTIHSNFYDYVLSFLLYRFEQPQIIRLNLTMFKIDALKLLELNAITSFKDGYSNQFNITLY